MDKQLVKLGLNKHVLNCLMLELIAQCTPLKRGF